MISGYLVGNRTDGEFLYYAPDRQMRYGSAYRDDELIYLFSIGKFGFLTCRGSILYIVKTAYHDRKISICELSTRFFLSSNPNFKDRTGYTNFNREKVSGWELFDVSSSQKESSWLEIYFKLIETRSLQCLFNTIKNLKNIDIPLLSYIINTHSIEDLDNAIKANLDDHIFLKGVLQIAGGNYLITPLLNELIQPSPPSKPRFIGKDRDIYGKGVDLRNPWVKLNSSVRRALRKYGNSCIVATARNEGVYIAEWVAYHLELGFEKIFIYTNNNQDGSLELLRALHDAGHIELIESEVGEGGNAQVKAYTHALLANLDVNRFEWCAFIDIDEFISFDQSRFSSLSDYLGWAGATGGEVIALSWILAANSLHSDDWVSEPMTHRINRQSPFQSNLIKCIVKPETAAFSGPHYPISTSGCALSIINSERQRYSYDRLENPTDITRASVPTFKNAYLYHFELKSFPELLWKYSRNRGNYSASTGDIQLNDHFIDRIAHFRKCLDNNNTELVKLTVPHDKTLSRMQDLFSDPRISNAQATVENLTRERFKKLIEYLPTFLKTLPDDERINRSKNWVEGQFLAAE